MKASFLFFLFLLCGSAFAANLKFDMLASGQIKATGTEFTESATGNKQVNFYKNGDFLTSITMNPNGSFSYTAPKETFIEADKLTVKVLQYLGKSSHFTKTVAYHYEVEKETIVFTSLEKGQIRAVGSNFTKSFTKLDQVNFYKNGKFLDQVKANANGSFSYTSPANTFTKADKMTVKVLNYLGNGEHFNKSSTYNYVAPVNDTEYIRGCSRMSSAANEAYCLKLKVPAAISAACTLTSSIYNEALCLYYGTNPQTTVACVKYMTSVYNESVCLWTKTLAPETIRYCGTYTTSVASELACIQNAKR